MWSGSSPSVAEAGIPLLEQALDAPEPPLISSFDPSEMRIDQRGARGGPRMQSTVPVRCSIWLISDGIGQNRIDAMTDPRRQSVHLGAGRWLGERHGQNVAVELQGNSSELPCNVFRHGLNGLGLGVIAARSTAGI